jgi:hypothetical protein
MLGGALAAPRLARAADEGVRSFRVLRGDDEIGWQTNRVARIGDTVTHEVEVRLKIKVFGITAYRYELDFAEEWKAGALRRLTSRGDNDGEPTFAEARRKGDVIEIEGSGHQGAAPWTAATTSYWAYPFLQKRTWISTQSGEPLQMAASRDREMLIPTQHVPTKAEKWRLTGGYEADIFYKDRDWVAISFDAGGETAVYLPDHVDPVFMPAWNATL